jgi:O-antigen/teichoic acid export membrane protein
VGGKAVELVSQALLITAVPAALGADDYGTLALILGVATVASSALAVGGPAAVSLAVSSAPAERRLATARALSVRGLLWRELAVAMALVVALAAGAPVAPAVLLAVAAGLDGAATTAAQGTLAAGRPWAFALRWPVQNLALVVAALAVHPEDATAAAATLALATAVAALFTGVAALRLLPRQGAAATGTGAGALAWRLGLAGALMQLQQRGAVPVAAALGVGAAEVGNAAVAIGAAVALTTAVVQLFLVELPGAARRVAAGHGEAVRDRAGRLAHGAIAGSAAIALGGAILGPPLIEALLGQDFESAAGALAPALAAVPLAPIAALGAHHALLDGRPAARMALAAAGALAFVVAAVVLLSSGSDAYAVAVATFAGAVAAAVAAAIYARPPIAMTAAAGAAAAVVWGVGALVA